MAESFDLVVIGAGPGGYVAAIRAAQLGLKVASVELEPQLGGTCLRIGCIPSKALLESSEHYEHARTSLRGHGVVTGEVGLDLAAMMKRKETIVATLTKGIEGLFKKNKIQRFTGRGRLLGRGRVQVTTPAGTTDLEARSVLLATGSRPMPLPGVEWHTDRIATSTEGLSYPSVPAHLVVIGAGYIGLELGSVWRRLGSKVTVIESLDRILPGMDLEIATEAKKLFEKQGLHFVLKSRVHAARVVEDRCVVRLDDETLIDADRVLVAVGRRPNVEDLGLEAVGIRLDDRGRIPVDHRFEAAPGVYAIGDVIPGPMLAHKAEEEGVAVAEILATGHGHVNYAVIPGVAYTHPEIATVGKSEEELKAAGVAYRKGVFPFMANGRARALGSTEGRVKVLADTQTDRVLGVHIIGPRAGDLIAEAVAAMAFGASSEDIARCCHAHPTLSEALKEAALAVDGRALHA
ncbi:MAG: dihydrolipoyl dehydrogenase [Verrucomicrobiales bacterium]|nr:dihydrolipoyl dehydrogenase [Verrucomicrobiales bacterium]